MPRQACFICGYPADLTFLGELAQVDCPRCSRYGITRTAVSVIEKAQFSPPQIATLSGWACENQPTRMSASDVERVVGRVRVSVEYRLNRLLLAIISETPALGSHVSLRGQKFVGVTYSQNEGELKFLAEQLYKQELAVTGGDWSSPVVLPAGFERAEKLRSVASPSSIGFCAMWFDESVTPVWTDAIEPGVRAAGFDPKRIDNVEHNNRIDEEILAWIRRSRFLVADLTGQRAGVYFEAGFALGLGLSVIWMVREDELASIHFDNRQYNFIRWRLDSLEEARSRLTNRIVATIGEGVHGSLS